MAGCKAPITTFIVEPFLPHDHEFYLNIVSERLGSSISFSECGGIDIEDNWDKVKSIFLPTDKPLSLDACAPLVATLPLEVRFFLSPIPSSPLFLLLAYFLALLSPGPSQNRQLHTGRLFCLPRSPTFSCPHYCFFPHAFRFISTTFTFYFHRFGFLIY